jgi:OPT family oligopeptide transporter
MLLGCIVGWGILSPLAYYLGWAPGPINDWKTGSKGWILWISLGVMISESIVSLVIVFVKQVIVLIQSRNSKEHINQNEDSEQRQRFLDEDNAMGNNGCGENIDQSEKDMQDAPEEEQVSLVVTISGLILSVALCIAMVQIVFGNQVISVGMTLVSILFALFLSILGVRALGNTDLNPVSGIGKMSQVTFAFIMPGAILANLIAGGIAEAGAQQAGDLMQDLKTGFLIKASPKAQFYGQLIGSLVSSFVATGAYLLYTTVYDIPGPQFPAPTAQVWLDMSRLANGHPLPPHISEFIVIFSIVFAVLVLIKETGSTMDNDTSWRRFIPQGISFAIGIYNPPNFTLARVIGGLLCSIWDSYCDSNADKHGKLTWFLNRWCISYRKIGKVFIIIVASGFVLGEGTFAIVNMILHACHVPHF